MVSSDIGKTRGRWRRYAAKGGAALIALSSLAGGGASAQGQTGAPDPVAELIRKAEAKELDGGFCAAVSGWPPGDRRSYVYFLDGARLGFAKVNTFNAGAQCQFDRVTEVYRQNGRKCVRYAWWACVRGANCARGEDADCKLASGDWERQR